MLDDLDVNDQLLFTSFVLEDIELEKLLFTYIDKVRRIHSGEIFFKTPEFIEVFGDVPL